MTKVRVAAVGGDGQFAPTVARSLGTAQDDVATIASVPLAERAILENGRLYDVLVLAPTVSEEDAASIARFVQKETPTTAVIVARDAPIDGEFPRLVRSGARDVVDVSRGTQELREALERAVDWTSGFANGAPGSDARGGQGAIVAVFSTKGGTGKTFFSCNLAAALAERTHTEVGLVDLDHDLGDVFAYFGAAPRRPLPELLLLEEGASPDEVRDLGTPLGGSVIGFGSPPDPRAEPLPSGAVTRMLRTLKDTFAFTVVDATSEYSDHVLAAFDLADTICLVSGLDAIGIRHLSLGMRTLDELGVPRSRLRVILNRADSKVDLTPDDVERLLSLKVDARIPSSQLVPRSINRAKLVWFEERRSDVAKAIESFADRLASEVMPEPNGQTNGTKRPFWKRG
jgi:pilus assembly protein CpaE